MAITTRSLRDCSKNLQQKTSTGHLGPGQYFGGNKRSAGPGYAPFSSLTARELAVPSQEGVPAPGTYDPKPSVSFESALPKKYVPFKASAARFGGSNDMFRGTAENPGPGSYEVSSRGQRSGRSRTMGSVEEKPLMRILSAPSIPVLAQSFGYDEGPGGRLVRMPVPNDIRGGVPGDSVGPDAYTPADNWCHQKAPAFSQSRAARTGPAPEKAVDGPGPGTYEAGRSPPRRQYGRHSSNFASSVPRDVESKTRERVEDDKPGPGQYDAMALFETAKVASKGRPREFQFFGSAVPRFERKQDQSEFPGPGSYAGKSNFGQQKSSLFGKGTGRDQSFNDFSSAPQAANPGPGAYETDKHSGPALEGEGPHNVASFSVKAAQGSLAFGAFSRRFPRRPEKQADPGPGAYEAKPAVASRRAGPHPTSSFRASSEPPKPPHPRKPDPDAPAPWAYDPKPIAHTTNVVRVPSKQEGFLSAVQRFKPPGVDAKPGPGQYATQQQMVSKTFNRAIRGSSRGRGGSVGFIATDKRFRDPSPVREAPGPGQYSVPASWTKKTFNTLYGEVL
mmetsp:Transcript_23800/g.52403  ORF Transcript_23800/g.52403 Transcript_23800/m.52403 type:complete len:561 (-) Transcript_23800:148-1830(-)